LAELFDEWRDSVKKDYISKDDHLDALAEMDNDWREDVDENYVKKDVLRFWTPPSQFCSGFNASI
jgi:hypothetical protein